MEQNIEYRSFDFLDTKVDAEKRTIVGRSVPYNSTSNTLRTTSGDTFKEIILPGSIDESVANNDILALREHNSAMLLGRTSAGTLKLENRADGLYAEINVPPTSYGNDTLVSAARGDLRGFSFGFNKPKAKLFSRSGEKIREIYSMNLREVSIVSSPAYADTTLALRSEEFVEENRGVVEKVEKEVSAVPPLASEEKKDHSRELEIWNWKLKLYGATKPCAK